MAILTRIETKRLIIRTFSADLAAAFFELSQDEGFTAFPINIYRQDSLETAREWVSVVKGKYAVMEKSSDELIGMGGLTPWTYEGEEMVDITYRLKTSAQGKGLGRELAEALVNHGFGELGLTQITATITPDNLPSIKLAAKLGWKFDRQILLKGVVTDLHRLNRT